MIYKYSKLLILFLLVVFFNARCLSQVFSFKINWEENVSVFDSAHIYNVLSFENADFNEYLIPSYINQIKIENGSNYIVKLKNVEFIAVNNSELSGIRDLDKISGEFEFSSHRVMAREKAFINFKISSIRRNTITGTYEKLVSFDIQADRQKNIIKSTTRYVNSSILRTGTWKKIRISESGIYKISFNELRNLGISNPQNVRVFGNASGWLPMIAGNERPDDLIENDILIENESLIFYGQGPDRWDFNSEKNLFEPQNHYYSDYAYYFLTSDLNTGYNNTIKTENQSTAPETHTFNYFTDYAVHENDIYNIAETGRIWYGESFDINNSQNLVFSFPNLINDATADIIVFAASTSASSYFNLNVNSVSTVINFSSFSDHDKAGRSHKELTFTTGTDDNINVFLEFVKSSPSACAWLDYMYINVDRELRFTSGQMPFRNHESYGAGNVTKYNISNAPASVLIWDITDKTKPKRILTTLSGTTQSFKSESSDLKEFIAFDKTEFKLPDLSFTETVENQNLHGLSGNFDMIIITHSNFLAQANAIKSIHEINDQMNVAVVTQQQVFNEFSCGAPDFSALRDFAKMIYEKSTEHRLKYLLLLGDGSYDNRGGSGINGNFILTYQQHFSEGLGSSFVTDDFFACLDDGEGDAGTGLLGLLDIGIGRIPVSNSFDAENYVSKIRHYISSETFADWRNRLCFIADDEDSKIHMIQTETLTNYIDTVYPVFNSDKIYFDAYTQYTESGGERYPDVNVALTNKIHNGALIVNYIGHGGEQGLAHERIVSISEIDNWRNFDKLPLFVTATCEFTRFDDYNFTSAGEHVFLNKYGGAIALFTTARIAWVGSNGELTKELYKNMFESFPDGSPYRLGDIIRITKVNKYNDDNLIFFLMGDPAVKLGYASNNKVVTTKINGHDIYQVDTLKALSKASFTGEVQDKNGVKLGNFNGSVFPTVYDKIRSVTTQNNDGIGSFSFETRDNIIYKGNAKVTNGNFYFEFIVPKDIALNVDTAKVSYYAENGITDAKGYNTDFLTGDISSEYDDDNTGPEIRLYMNDENFVSGGITNANPRIFAKLFDEHGINTASGGIGHDITGVVDNDIQKIIIMNDDYLADENTYKSGAVEHFLFDLETGEHHLKFKAWDVYNNSSEETIDFIVTEAEQLTIDRLLNYPNPFTTHTDFYFEHNQAGTEIELLIQIFTVSGKLVKSIEANYIADGYRAGPFAWDGTDDFGNRIGRGVYVYRVKLRTETGETVEKFEKLLILK